MKNISVSLHYGFVSQTYFARQLLPKGEALPVSVWEFRIWEIFPKSKIKYSYHKAIYTKVVSLLGKYL